MNFKRLSLKPFKKSRLTITQLHPDLRWKIQNEFPQSQSKQIDFLILNRLLFGKCCKHILKEGLIAIVQTCYFLWKFTILTKEQTCIILHVQTERRRDSIRSRDQQGDNNLYRGPWFESSAACIKGLAVIFLWNKLLTMIQWYLNKWPSFFHITGIEMILKWNSRNTTLISQSWNIQLQKHAISALSCFSVFYP